MSEPLPDPSLVDLGTPAYQPSPRGLSPFVVAQLRAVGLAAAGLIAAAVADGLDVLGNGRWGPYVAVVGYIWRGLLEGLRDQHTDPTRQVPLGGAPAGPR